MCFIKIRSRPVWEAVRRQGGAIPAKDQDCQAMIALAVCLRPEHGEPADGGNYSDSDRIAELGPPELVKTPVWLGLK